MTSVLILSTSYDVNSTYTAKWAQELRDELVKRDDVYCFLYDAQYLCRSSKALDDAVDRADYVVFYGHGTRDSWIALPDYPGASAVDSSSVSVLKGKRVYAACCWSLSGLGSDYIVKFPHGEFVGYRHQFGFERSNADYFKTVVNQSISGFVLGDSLTATVASLQTKWANLRDDFHSGSLKRQPQAAMAAKMAEENRRRVGSRP
jgi:hypothetical protein